jgi:hypothetical protein
MTEKKQHFWGQKLLQIKTQAASGDLSVTTKNIYMPRSYDDGIYFTNTAIT